MANGEYLIAHHNSKGLSKQLYLLQEMASQVTTVLGIQWGDEGKGKLVDILARDMDVVARSAGGNNAGHTIVANGYRYALHLIPSGILYPGVKCLIGNGVVVHIPSLLDEIKGLESQGISCDGRILISNRAHVLFDFHKVLDRKSESGRHKIGTTGKGIGPCYTDKVARSGIRVGDLYTSSFPDKMRRLFQKHNFPDVERVISRYLSLAQDIKDMVVDSVYYINDSIAQGKRVLVEGANATMLDIDFGTYPYVTSSNPSIGGACTGLGIAPKYLSNIHGVVKAYTTRVGLGPFPTEVTDDVHAHLQTVGHEVGTTTGRPRRCGWLDIPMLRYTCMLNGISTICLTKIDVLTGLPEIKIGTHYTGTDGTPLPYGMYPASLDDLEAITVQYMVLPGWDEDISRCRSFSDLPMNAQAYVLCVQDLLGVGVSCIGVGPGRDDNIHM